MICTGCGSQIPDGSKFCPYCGFNGEQPKEKTPAAKSEKKSTRNNKKPEIRVIDPERKPPEDTSKWWIWAIIALVCAAILAFIFINGRNYIDYSDLGSLRAESSKEDSDGIHTDEGLLTVTITLPKAMFAQQDMAAFNPDAYAREQGFLSAEVNSDGSVTVTMSKARHQEVLDTMADSIQTLIDDLVGGEDTPYIHQIDYSDDFTRFEMYVDRAAYEDALDLTPLTLGIAAGMYQAFREMEYHTEIEIIDTDTNRIIQTVHYPAE